MAGKNPHVDIAPIKVSIQIAFNKFIYAICISLLQVLNSYKLLCHNFGIKLRYLKKRLTNSSDFL